MTVTRIGSSFVISNSNAYFAFLVDADKSSWSSAVFGCS